MSQEITNLPSEAPADNKPLALIRLALEKGMEPKELYELAKIMKTDEARASYALDMNGAQSVMPLVIKDAENKHTHTRYASLEAVNTIIKPIYTQHGFSISFAEGESRIPDEVRIIADVLHREGHEKRYFIDLPRDGTGLKGNSNMTAIQGKGSTFSYGKRYLICMIFNVTIADEDNDGNHPFQGISEAQAEELNNLLEKYDSLCLNRGNTLEQCETWHRKFWDFLGCKEGMNDLRAGDFSKAKDRLEKAIRGVKS